MNKLLLIGLVGGVAYMSMSRKPKISVEQKDILNRTAVIKIGTKTVNYVAKTGMTMLIPKVSMIYDAEISPNESGFVILIVKKGKTAFQENVSWS